MQYKRIQDTLHSFTSEGKFGPAVTSARTALEHADTLDKLVDKLGNSKYAPGILNPIRGAVLRNKGDEKYQTAYGEWMQNADHLAIELDKALKGSGSPDVHGVESIRKNLDPNLPPAELHAAIRQSIRLLSKRLHEVNTSYKEGMGPKADPNFDPLTPEHRKIYEGLTGVIHGDKEPAKPGAPSQSAAPDVPVVTDKAQAAAQPIGKVFMYNGHKAKRTGPETFVTVE
jgi:hypothetical protein